MPELRLSVHWLGWHGVGRRLLPAKFWAAPSPPWFLLFVSWLCAGLMVSYGGSRADA